MANTQLIKDARQAIAGHFAAPYPESIMKRLLAALEAAEHERAGALAVIAELRAVTRDASVAYTVNNSEDLAVRAGLEPIAMSPMMVERAALDAVLDKAGE